MTIHDLAVKQLKIHESCIRRERVSTMRNNRVIFLTNHETNNSWMAPLFKDHPNQTDAPSIQWPKTLEGYWEESREIDPQAWERLYNCDFNNESIIPDPFIFVNVTEQFNHAADSAIYAAQSMKQFDSVIKNCNRYKWLWIAVLVSSPLMFMMLIWFKVFK